MYLLYLKGLRCCLLLLIKQNCFQKTFLRTQISCLKLHNIHITPKLIKKVITNLDLSKTSGPDCIPVVVLKKWKPELSYILLKASICAWRNLLFQTAGRSHLWSQYLKMLRRGLPKNWFQIFWKNCRSSDSCI